MTLEKLLIFGFGLAVMGAIVLLADGQTDNRDASKNDWKTSVEELAEKP